MTLQLAQPRLKTFRLNVSQYHQMSEAGIFSENDKVELINGEIIEMSPIGRRHAACVDRINRLFSNILGIKVIVRVQNPIILNNLSEPEPDIALLKPRADFYESGHPQPQDIFLLIEVADSSLEYDRDVKIPLYASSGISEVWLVDIYEQVIIVYRYPSENGYSDIQTLSRGEKLSIQTFPEINLVVNDILGSISA
ncbi:Uma2 family endonuclease [Dolichospermum sp. ST_con]|nr:Uma2 family endonuclease [Dolichospermum sp. ST_con]MDD1421244.1 Uma2 family endonuclease [Dolichospermum sp. ST_sed1]MDD1424340.1 Uma2 family endonuclease [Dolichospermum sp. ST_sed9]MDD1430804.1 Uma2 family endonuclease [Dolichospermum sp. ST_sed6]MDD1442259.1 Uma2 family endonuclease [Dolichospermum sp. ST_sed3]MDD1448051.1 Uma2 family endonuclease [Dolichospermum sp. ST_sed8]MDD1456354.1 Uma2 family endonuclease [Dolichospermum sp. ST_sed7]MDD1458704.1 Uma2 family endonuclease [Dolich